MKLVRWTILAIGVAMVALFTTMLVLFSTTLERFGGIPWSWDLLRLNAGWVALLLCGLLFLGIALRLFLNDRNRSNSN